ncbi:MAG: hypothetical protein H7Z38_04675 [Rubrivivax sp.]|nr:hypothetical protein [Pyrinomonadaceae bacterium]
MKRRTEITIETERVVMLEGGREDVVQWCEKCGAESRLIAPDTAATLLGVHPQVILRWAEAAGLHFAGGADGAPLLCLNSLPRGEAHDTRAVEMKTDDGERFQPEF